MSDAEIIAALYRRLCDTRRELSAYAELEDERDLITETLHEVDPFIPTPLRLAHR